MITAAYFKKLLDFVHEAHQVNARESSYTTRQKGTVPFTAHPLWCALMLLEDATVNQDERELGFQVLLLHDVLEDTKEALPGWIDPSVPPLVREMTYASWEAERAEALRKNEFLQLLKLIDKVSTIYDRGIGTRSKGREWRDLAQQLWRNTRARYGHTQVHKLMSMIIHEWHEV